MLTLAVFWGHVMGAFLSYRWTSPWKRYSKPCFYTHGGPRQDSVRSSVNGALCFYFMGLFDTCCSALSGAWHESPCLYCPLGPCTAIPDLHLVPWPRPWSFGAVISSRSLDSGAWRTHLSLSLLSRKTRSGQWQDGLSSRNTRTGVLATRGRCVISVSTLSPAQKTASHFPDLHLTWGLALCCLSVLPSGCGQCSSSPL